MKALSWTLRDICAHSSVVVYSVLIAGVKSYMQITLLLLSGCSKPGNTFPLTSTGGNITVCCNEIGCQLLQQKRCTVEYYT
ncbi:hypothetical protein GDO81_000515 [Engystomops pustulosus]|uniref:Uncharacterized protein n=1 Tax=Engystomops pustulosus TaxID=76066 RepID=A0AAV7D4T0_ENGPU|nr:hypothetical protein GDO81_000515 [Engystomops pustulosus]